MSRDGNVTDIAPALLAIGVALLALSLACAAGVLTGEWLWLAATAVGSVGVLAVGFIASLYRIAERRAIAEGRVRR